MAIRQASLGTTGRATQVGVAGSAFHGDGSGRGRILTKVEKADERILGSLKKTGGLPMQENTSHAPAGGSANQPQSQSVSY
jgi:hypothetical protein